MLDKEQGRFENKTLIAVIIVGTLLLQLCLFTFKLNFAAFFYEQANLSIYVRVETVEQRLETNDEGNYLSRQTDRQTHVAS